MSRSGLTDNPNVIPSIFNRSTIGALTQSLDAAALRQEAIAANLANANTPGYHRKEVAFRLPSQDAESQGMALRRTDPRHLGARPFEAQAISPRIVTDTTGAMRLDGSNVDPDAETTRLAETEVTYSALTSALSSQFSALRIAITGSGR